MAWPPSTLREATPPFAAHPGVLDIWSIPLDLADAEVARCDAVLSDEERSRAQRFVRARDGRRYIVAHAGLRFLLSQYTRRRAADMRFALGPHGKPALVGEAPADISFNLSHSGELAIVGITRGSRVGVDVEEIRVVEDALSIARSFFAGPEIAALESAPTTSADLIFLRCWTRKEAFIKAIGDGLSFPLDSFAVDLSFERPAIRFLSGGDPDTNWTMIHLEPKDGYVGAAAVEGPVSVVPRTLALAS